MNKIIKVTRGDSENIKATFTNSSDGTPFNLTGYAVFFTVMKECDINDANDDNALIKKKVTVHTNAAGGITEIPLTASDTNLAPGIYYWDMQVVNGATISSTQRGEFEVVNDITKRIV